LFLSALLFLSVGRFGQGPGGVALADRSRRRLHAGLLFHLVDDADGKIGQVVVVEVDFAVWGFFEISVLPERLAEAGFGGFPGVDDDFVLRSEEHTSELQSLAYLVCRLLLEKKK